MYRSARMEAFINKVKKRCDQKWGLRAELAKYLQTNRQTITHMFAGRQNPTGEQVLLLIEWLEKTKR